MLLLALFMKRSVIQLAGKTSVISLPSKWVQRYGICKGDELDVEEKEDHLLIRSKKSASPENVVVDVSGLGERAIRHVLSGLHRYGYDELIVVYNDAKTLEVVNDLVKNTFIGFAVVEQSQKKCKLRGISSEIPQEFESALRRAFLVTLSLGNSIAEVIGEKNFKALPHLVNLESTNNQLTNFCERVLSKQAGAKENMVKYVVVWNLEKIADEYKYLCVELSLQKEGIRPEVSKAFEEVNGVLKDFYELFYKFEMKRFDSLTTNGKRLEEVIKNIKALNKGEFQLVSRSLIILQRTLDFSTLFYSLNHKLS